MDRKTRLAILLLVGVAAFIPQRNAAAQQSAYAGATITGTVYFVGGPRPGCSLPFRLISNFESGKEGINE